MKSLYTFGLFCFLMGVVITVFPYITALPSRFNKDRVLAWRKFFIIIVVSYLPVFAILYGGYIISSYNAESLRGNIWPLWDEYYFVYILLVAFLKKRTNLQLGWLTVVILSTLYYWMNNIFIVNILFDFTGHPLGCMTGLCNYGIRHY